MKYCPIVSWRTFIIIYIICLQISCAKDADLLSEYVINDTNAVEKGINFENAIKIPIDFDWSNIPDEYENQVLEINGAFDLKGQNIVLPVNVTLYFNEGHFENGTIEGDETFIYSDTGEPIVTDASFTGTYENEYVKPHWFGAVMDGVTDDRDVFVETLAYADSLGLRILIEKDIFLDVEETGTKSIFLEDNTWIEGVNGSRIIVNNLLSPAFIVALAENITLKNITIFYDQNYDANYGYDSQMAISNSTQIENYLVENRGLIFNGQDPVWRGQVNFRYTILLEAAKNVLFDNVKMIAKGSTADSFMVGAIKLKEEYSANQIISNNSATTSICNNIYFKNLVIDGAIMGIQGIVDNLTIDGLKSYRYSDVQSSDGNLIGGKNYWMPPPHLIYLNSDSSIDYSCKNINILNSIDYGNYIGSTNVRATVSGYCNSLKLVDSLENVVVENYKSYRRDGLGDWGGIKNGLFNNIYAESRIEVFNSDYKFSSLRFLNPLENVSISNLTIKDVSEYLEIYPMNYSLGNNVTMDAVNVVVNKLNNTVAGPFGISGSNNSVINSKLIINNHVSTENYSAIIYHDNKTLEEGENNYYDIEVKGWRPLGNEPAEKSPRVLLANSKNTNSNYAKINDLDNNFLIEQIDNIKKDAWTKSKLVSLNNSTAQNVNLDIPSGYKLSRIRASIEEGILNDVQITLGTSETQKANILYSISNSANFLSRNFVDGDVIEGPKSIYLFSNKKFENTGKINIEIELERYTSY